MKLETRTKGIVVNTGLPGSRMGNWYGMNQSDKPTTNSLEDTAFHTSQAAMSASREAKTYGDHVQASLLHKDASRSFMKMYNKNKDSGSLHLAAMHDSHAKLHAAHAGLIDHLEEYPVPGVNSQAKGKNKDVGSAFLSRHAGQAGKIKDDDDDEEENEDDKK